MAERIQVKKCPNCKAPYKHKIKCKCGVVGCNECINDGVCIDCLVNNSKHRELELYKIDKILFEEEKART